LPFWKDKGNRTFARMTIHLRGETRFQGLNRQKLWVPVPPQDAGPVGGGRA